MEPQVLLPAFRRIRQSLEHLHPYGEMANRLLVRRALRRALPGGQPVRDGLRTQTGLGVMVRQQLGLGLADLGELRLQHLGNALVVLLAGTLQQRLIGRVLDQGVLETVRRLRWQPLLIQELCYY